MTIFLIRHGETAANAARIVQVPETPLNERGLEQADLLAQRLAESGIRLILSSDLARARMTAERLHAVLGVPIAFDPGLQERNYGELRGRAYAEFDFNIHEPGYAPPGGEDWPSFDRRVDAVWPRVLETRARADGPIAVVTHGLVCRSMCVRLFELPDGASNAHLFPNTSLTIVDPDPPHRVSLLNCAQHLDGGPTDVGMPSGL
jgi:2,3-bisphosphoglycerate-dependent phosphoglycerate mutase